MGLLGLFFLRRLLGELLLLLRPTSGAVLPVMDTSVTEDMLALVCGRGEMSPDGPLLSIERALSGARPSWSWSPLDTPRNCCGWPDFSSCWSSPPCSCEDCGSGPPPSSAWGRACRTWSPFGANEGPACSFDCRSCLSFKGSLSTADPPSLGEAWHSPIVPAVLSLDVPANK